MKLSGGLWVEARLEATQSFGLIDLQMQPGVKRLFLFFYLSIINTNAEYDDNNCGRNHCQLELLFKCTLISIDLFCALGWKSIVGLQTFVRKQTRKRSWNYIVSENDSVMPRTHLYNKVLLTTPNIYYLNIGTKNSREWHKMAQYANEFKQHSKKTN